MALPKHVDEAVCRRLFDDMRSMGWETLSSVERTQQYEKWVGDPEVGGRLTAFMSEAGARVWIKDGPAKEYQRALAGIGKYAVYADADQSRVSEIVHHALGSGWQVQPASLRIKPLRVTASQEENDSVVTWGPARDLKHLVWAALTAQADGDAREWVLVVISSFVRPASTADKQAHARLATRVGLRITHMELG